MQLSGADHSGLRSKDHRRWWTREREFGSAGIPPAADAQSRQSDGTRGGCSFFKLRFAVADIPQWSAHYSYAGSDSRFLSEVRPAVRRRGYLTAVEFRDICYWKTPRSQSRCRQNTADDIRVLTAAALATRDEALKMDLLRRLRGVEWPTASTLLHFCDLRPYPILDYRALWSLGYPRPPHYTMPFWLEYVAYVRELVRRSGHSIRTVDRALWQYSKARQR
jgi:hypothetical protein